MEINENEDVKVSVFVDFTRKISLMCLLADETLGNKLSSHIKISEELFEVS
ncbi:MAG: hypothetical protein RSB69_06265 [Odoribacter sp.]